MVMDIPDRFMVYINPRKKNKFHGFDEVKKAYIVDVDAPPEKGKANAELIRFLSKSLKKQVRIVSGLTSRRKIVQVLEK